MQTKKKVDAKYYDAVISKSKNIQKNWVETGRQNGKVILERRGTVSDITDNCGKDPEQEDGKIKSMSKPAQQESSGQPGEAKPTTKKPKSKPKGGNAREVLTPRR